MATIDRISPELLSSMNASGGRKSIAGDAQDRFMTLLVTQMKNQDPLNPLDNAQVTSQLAQLSTVTGIDKLNVSLEALKASFQSGQALQAAGMIGRQVMVPGEDMVLAGGKAIFGIELTEPADKAMVTIRDAAGNALRQIELGARDAGLAHLEWDGKTDAGVRVADGKYRFQVDALHGGRQVAASSLAVGEVVSVSTGSQGIRLRIGDSGETDLSEVRRVM